MNRRSFVTELGQFVVETKRSFEELASSLGWTLERLSQADNDFASCPYDSSHRVPVSSLRKHTTRCRLRRQNIDPRSNDEESTDFFYENSRSVTTVRIDKSLRKRILKRNQEINEVRKDFAIEESSLEDTKQQTPAFRNALDEIEFIYSWSQIPASYCKLDLSALEPNSVKGWIVNHLPAVGQFQSATLEVDLIHFVYSSLFACSPEAIGSRLTPYLAGDAPHFVLSLWKFLALSLVQSKNKLNQDDVDDAKLRGQAKLKASQGNKTGASLVSLLADEDNAASNEDDDFSDEERPLTVDERRAVYDYVAEKSRLESRRAPTDMTELLAEATEDFERVKAKLQQPQQSDETKTYNEQIAILRDYKRRRQSYRAKNTRITKRTPTQVLKDLIDVRMEILAQSAPRGKEESEQRKQGEDGGNERRRKRRHSKKQKLLPGRT
eukprot:m.64647 g.64647  ORF g.64647 m.64647 type:complete len:438 (+) comp35269_c0_seq3:17-1330(+)